MNFGMRLLGTTGCTGEGGRERGREGGGREGGRGEEGREGGRGRGREGEREREGERRIKERLCARK